jgi:hypothetical protein
LRGNHQKIDVHGIFVLTVPMPMAAMDILFVALFAMNVGDA